jgi:hypothetical protein
MHLVFPLFIVGVLRHKNVGVEVLRASDQDNDDHCMCPLSYGCVGGGDTAFN